MKSNYWKFKIYKSRRQKDQNGAAKTGYCGPYFFEQPISNLEFKKWIRGVLGINDTSHIEAEISLSEKRNESAYSTWKKQMNLELAQSQHAKSGARSGNLIVKWLSPLTN